jgi:hypothetical protein
MNEDNFNTFYKHYRDIIDPSQNTKEELNWNKLISQINVIIRSISDNTGKQRVFNSIFSKVIDLKSIVTKSTEIVIPENENNYTERIVKLYEKLKTIENFNSCTIESYTFYQILM